MVRVGTGRVQGRRGGGFTLLELLIVIVIATILLALIVPAVVGPMRASRLTMASDALIADLESARGRANLHSAPVTFQFIRITSPGIDGSGSGLTARYPGYRILQQRPDGTLETGQLTVLPETVAPLEGTVDGNLYETLLTDSAASVQTGVTDPAIPGATVDLISFRFFPDGSTDLPPAPSDSPGDKWFITLSYALAGNVDRAPKNFSAITIDPVTGRVFHFRP